MKPLLQPRLKPMLKPHFLLALLLLPGLSLLIPRRAWSQTMAEARLADTLDVSAQGRFEADPDTAVIQINIHGTDRDLKKAYAIAQRQAEQVRSLLRSQGIPSTQAQLGSYQVQPNIDWRTHKLIDYTVAASLQIELTDFAKIGPLVDAAGQAGMPAIGHVSFELKDMQRARQQAIADGYHRAFAEAQELARLAGRSIQKLRYASVDVNQPSPIFYARPMMMERAAGASMPAPTEQFTPKKVTVTAQVRATFQMTP